MAKNASRSQKEKSASAQEALTERLARVLGFNTEEREIFAKQRSVWEASLHDFEEELKRSESVSEDDLAIRINVRDFD